MNGEDTIKRIHQWQKDRLLDTKPFNLRLEIGFIIEELLESTGSYTSETAKEKSQKITDIILEGIDETNINVDAVVDAFGDIIVYSVGAIAKTKHNPYIVMSEVLQEIESRTGEIVDGKFVKDLNAKTYKADFSLARITPPPTRESKNIR
ncbi:MAG: hypothetical protein QM526_00465 [Alphaproteobacteria bacterium]|nr:hypothetical protein [Alphaproteobacteria bacterium]